MAPLLLRRDSGVQIQTWLIVVAVVVPVAVTAVVVYFAVHFAVFRFRNNQYRAAATRDPYLSRKEWARRRKLSALQRIEEEEIQRHLILRKTLTSQTSSRHDLDAVESRPDRSSLDESRMEGGNEQRGEKRWRRWGSRHGLEKETEDSEGHPLIGEHPAIKADAEQHRPSASPTRMPLLLLAQEPEQERASLLERRLSEVHPRLGRRLISASPQKAPRSSSPVPKPLDYPYVSPHPAYALRISTPGQARDIDALREQSSAQRTRAASADARHIHHQRHQSSTSSFHSRTPSSLPDGPLSQIHIPARGRSSTVSPPLFPDLVSPPPPVAVPHSASPRAGGFLPPRFEGPSMPTRADLFVLPWELRQTMHTRTRSHEVLVDSRFRSHSPAQSTQRKHVPGRAHNRSLSTGLLAVGTRGAAFALPAVSPVEEALDESERTPVTPGGDTFIAGAASAPPVSEKKETDRDMLPSPVPRSFDPENPAPPPQHRSSIAGPGADPPSFSFEEGDHLKELGISVRSPAQQHSEPPAYLAGPPPPLPPPGRDTVHADMMKQGETGTAFSFEEGGRHEELNISLRIPRQQRSEPLILPAVPSSPQGDTNNTNHAITEKQEEAGTAFSFEEGGHLKELNISLRIPRQQRSEPLILPVVPSSPQGDTNNTNHAITEKQEEAGTAFSFEEGVHLKELGIPLRDPAPPNRRTPPPRYLPIPTPNRDRSRSLESQNNSLNAAGLSPEDAVRRLRSRSFENMLGAGAGAGAQGKWELQVSVLDQTGARSPQASSHGGGTAYHSSASEPASPERDDTFDAESGAARGVSGARGARPRSGSSHLRSPSTPMTSPEPDSALCRANFASPGRERFLAESPQKPPPSFSPQYPQAPVPPPMASPPVASPSPFASPSWSGWSPRGRGDAEGVTVEAEYETDTMKQAVGPPVVGGESGRGEMSFRLSGPPDLMPAFF